MTWMGSFSSLNSFAMAPAQLHVGLVFQSVDLDALFQDQLRVLEIPHPGDSLADPFGPGLKNSGEVPELLAIPVDLVQGDSLRRRFHEVHDVVHLRNQAKDVVAVDGRDEHLVQAFDHVVGNGVAFALDRLDPRAGLGRRQLALGHVHEGPTPLNRLLRVLFEVVEEGFIPGKQSHDARLYRRSPSPCQWSKQIETKPQTRERQNARGIVRP